MRNKLLAVDDEPVNVELITGILENDYEIIPAYSGREALESEPLHSTMEAIGR